MAYTFYKRNADNAFYAMDAEAKIFKVVSDPDNTGSVMCSILTNNIAELNIIQINSQISSNPAAFTSVQEIDFNNRIFAIKGYLEENL